MVQQISAMNKKSYFSKAYCLIALCNRVHVKINFIIFSSGVNINVFNLNQQLMTFKNNVIGTSDIG